MSEKEFADKVEWEGGLYEALFSYGLKSSDLEDGELKEAIEFVEKRSKDFIEAMDRAESLLEDLTVEY